MNKCLLFFSLLILLVCCRHKDSIPKDILPQDKMREVLWDMINAGQYLSVYVLPMDTIDKIGTSARVYGQVFQLYHITKDEFDKSFSYYREHPDLMKVILDSLSRRQNYDAERFHRRDSLRKKAVLDKKIR